MSELSLHIGSIFDVPGVDAIVNPANGHLRHGGGLAALIDREARDASNGPQQRPGQSIESFFAPREAWDRDHKVAPLIATGDCYVTSAGFLPYKGIIHAVGPIWGGGHFYENELLASALSMSIEAAYARGWDHIAVPAISCGIFGFPVRAAARILVDEARYNELDVDVTFAVMGDEHATAFSEYIDGPLFG